ncbi:MAG TPA: DJ-1/PfpI family protein [Stellaceae bacterium]|jgi:cyclohexyl-isocyanide hydratase
MIIGIPVYEGVDLLDVMGPHEMFGWAKSPHFEIDVLIVGETLRRVTSRDGVTFLPHASFRQIERSGRQLDVIWVPGGDPDALKRLMTDKRRRYLNFVIAQSRQARITASVCEGALLLAQAGLLDGYRATTHWAFIPCLKQFPAVTVVPGTPRFVIDRDRLTGGGISSGLDEALALIELLAGTKVAQSVQQTTQYYPDPPVCSDLPEATDCPFSWHL